MSTPTRYTHLSEPDPAWLAVAEAHAPLDALAAKMYSLPISEFRKVPYKPGPLPDNVPKPGIDITIRTDKVLVRDGTSIGVRIYEPLQRHDGQTLFFNVHGGGWTVGTPETEEAQNRMVAAGTDCVVVSVDYRLAPEFPFPYAVHDSMDALLWCIDQAVDLGIDPHKIVLGGGSAGANICAALSLICRDTGIQGTIIGQVLNIPVTCHPAHFPADQYEYRSYEQNKEVPLVDAARMHLYWYFYVPNPEIDGSNPLVSPLLAESLANLPPALVQVAGMDPLRDEGLAFAQALEKSGVNTTVKIYPGMPHAFYVYPNLTPSADYFETTVQWIRDVLQGDKETKNKETN
ncbi:hypothetical protein Sste5346_009742 [Sporothrix stenoceras]|uniref:Alpha/beta hydrolase fold-3 domain-containing protein n=1 Tax=Sporothrix stenoceras TaxID=5173 RepID=A0ABR3YJS7_9PEZI